MLRLNIVGKYGYAVKHQPLLIKPIWPLGCIGDAIPSEEDIMFRGRELISDMQVFVNIIFPTLAKTAELDSLKIWNQFFQAAILYVATEYPENQRSFPDVVQFML